MFNKSHLNLTLELIHRISVRRLWLFFVIIAFGTTLIVVIRNEALQSAIEIGGDEHFEVTKGFLWAKGFSLYQQVWNDQPPLISVILGLNFKWISMSIGQARLLAAIFGVLLIVGCMQVVKVRGGVAMAVVSGAYLVCAPQVFELCTSMMLEVPAIGTAVWGLWSLFKWQERQRWPWLMISGCFLAAALHMKLTALIVVPAVIAEIIVWAQWTVKEGWVRIASRAILVLSGSVAITYAGLVAAIGTVPFNVFWASHFSKQVLLQPGAISELSFWSLMWHDHIDGICAASTGLLLMIWRRDWRKMTFALIWLVTVSFTHFLHRPWWPYYYLHFAVPLAWLSGYGICELYRIGLSFAEKRTLRSHLLTYGCVVTASIVLALAWAYGGNRLRAEAKIIKERPRVQESTLLAQMKKYANATRWVYTQETMYAFHSGLVVIPELAVMPEKRFWSGQITEQQIWATVRRYQPEQLLLVDKELHPDIREFVEAGYTRIYQDGALVLYVSKSLVEK